MILTFLIFLVSAHGIVLPCQPNA